MGPGVPGGSRHWQRLLSRPHVQAGRSSSPGRRAAVARSCRHTSEPNLTLLPQGALLWKWALSPPADPTDGLEVGLRDSTFLGVVAPAARAALNIARRASVPGCQPVRCRC